MRRLIHAPQAADRAYEAIPAFSNPRAECCTQGRMALGVTRSCTRASFRRRPLVRTDAADMLKRRLKQAGLPAHYSPHSFRATGITNFLENDGTLEAAQSIAGQLLMNHKCLQ